MSYVRLLGRNVRLSTGYVRLLGRNVRLSTGYVRLSLGYVRLSLGYVRLSMSYVRLLGRYVRVSMSYVRLLGSYVRVSMSYVRLFADMSNFTGKCPTIFEIRQFKIPILPKRDPDPHTKKTEAKLPGRANLPLARGLNNKKGCWNFHPTASLFKFYSSSCSSKNVLSISSIKSHSSSVSIGTKSPSSSFSFGVNAEA